MADPNEVDYKFVNGNGDDTHESAITALGKQGYNAIHMAFDPDETKVNNRLIVLMKKN